MINLFLILNHLKKFKFSHFDPNLKFFDLFYLKINKNLNILKISKIITFQ